MVRFWASLSLKKAHEAETSCAQSMINKSSNSTPCKRSPVGMPITSVLAGKSIFARYSLWCWIDKLVLIRITQTLNHSCTDRGFCRLLGAQHPRVDTFPNTVLVENSFVFHPNSSSRVWAITRLKTPCRFHYPAHRTSTPIRCSIIIEKRRLYCRKVDP